MRARVPTPPSYERISTEPRSFGAWLRTLPIKPGTPAVHLHNGDLKRNQDAHHLVIDIDVGSGDLQQCADAVMRLRAEYLFAQERYADIHFRFTTGDVASYPKWQQGYRPRVEGNSVEWGLTARVDTTYAGFRRYLTSVFTYAGTASLSREMKSRLLEDMQIGDVFIQGGYPGHAVIVLDMAQQATTGKKLFLLGQSYMPAQDMHVLRNPSDDELTPWYPLDFGSTLVTPEWKFSREDLKYFSP